MQQRHRAAVVTSPSATDLRLQITNNMCMDASGNPVAGGAVVFNTCNDATSQQWIFDGGNLRPQLEREPN